MADGSYEVIALVPPGRGFEIGEVVRHFRSVPHGALLRSESLRSDSEIGREGFRVWYGEWSVEAWLDRSPSVVVDNEDLAVDAPLAISDSVRGSAERLFVCSAKDPHYEHTGDFMHFTDLLQQHYGLLIYDHVVGEWYTQPTTGS